MNDEFGLLDPRRLLGSPAVYGHAQRIIRGSFFYEVLVEGYLRIQPGERILDVGCGPAQVLSYLPSVDYVGFDASPRYIAAARRRFGDRGRFLCRTLHQSELEELGPSSFDAVYSNGLLHHLDDDEAGSFFALAKAALAPGGRLVTIDGCFETGQSRIAEVLLARDRGRFVRRRADYVDLAQKSFPEVASDVRHDLLRIPYSLAILECREEASGG